MDALADCLGINEFGFAEQNGTDIIVIFKKIGKVEYFLGKKASGRYFIYRKDLEAIFYIDESDYYPIETKEEIYLKPKKTLM